MESCLLRFHALPVLPVISVVNFVIRFSKEDGHDEPSESGVSGQESVTQPAHKLLTPDP